jgi:hypothetical protein
MSPPGTGLQVKVTVSDQSTLEERHCTGKWIGKRKMKRLETLFDLGGTSGQDSLRKKDWPEGKRPAFCASSWGGWGLVRPQSHSVLLQQRKKAHLLMVIGSWGSALFAQVLHK